MANIFPKTPLGAQKIALKQPFVFQNGESLEGLELVYETWGALNSDASNALLICGGMSPSSHVASHENNTEPGWWQGMVGESMPIDTKQWFVVCVNPIGSCFGSSGPASVNPATGKPYQVNFPSIAIEDIAASFDLVRSELGIDCFKALVGPSMGGMVAQSYAKQFPSRSENLALISTAVAAEPFAIALRSLQRELVMSDEKWQDGRYALEDQPKKGLRLARKLGMTTYRSDIEWAERFGRTLQSTQPDKTAFMGRFEVESYLAVHADKFADLFDANCFLYLSSAMDQFSIANGGDTEDAAVQKMAIKNALVVGVASDALIPLHQQKYLATLLARNDVPVTFESLPSIQGHDSFLVDLDRFGPVVRSFLDSI